MVKGSKVHLKGGRVRKCTILEMENEKVKKYKDSSSGLILMGGLPKSNISQKWEIFTSMFSFFFPHFKVAFLLKDPIGDFSYEYL